VWGSGNTEPEHSKKNTCVERDILIDRVVGDARAWQQPKKAVTHQVVTLVALLLGAHDGQATDDRYQKGPRTTELVSASLWFRTRCVFLSCFKDGLSIRTVEYQR
jgi:hypothetical protein